MFRFSKLKKKLQEAAVNKFFASWLRGWCDGIVRGLVQLWQGMGSFKVLASGF